MQQEINKRFSLVEISPLELVAINSPDSNENACNRKVNLLTNCPKSSDMSRTNLFLLLLT